MAGRSRCTRICALVRALPLAVAVQARQPTTIHVVSSNHLDVGFNERSWNDHHAAEGDAACDGPFSPDGERCEPLAANVTSEYFNTYFPRAASMAEAYRKAGARYTYMAQPWVVALFLDCQESGVRDWRSGHRELLLTCPNSSTVTQFREAVTRGDIWLQAFPHNGSPETYDASLFAASLRIGARLADELGVPTPRTFSQRDETGMTRAIIPLLRAHGVRYISLGSGGSKPGHPVLPGSAGLPGNASGVFVWRDERSRTEVLMTADHGYGGGLHVLPVSGTSLFSAWNRDNSGPSKEVFDNAVAMLRQRFPSAKIKASTFDAFFAEAEKERGSLPVVTQEIGDTWLYGVPSDPFKNVLFREVSRRRADCIQRGECDPEATDFVRFDRLLTLIPEHTWGLDTTFYLHDYTNWSNAQFQSALALPNYQLAVQSWLEQRSYIQNAVALLQDQHLPFQTEIRETLASLAPASLARDRASSMESLMLVPAAEATNTTFRCSAHGVFLTFAPDGSIATLRHTRNQKAVFGGNGVFGRVTYQTLAADNFTQFDALYTGNCLSHNQTAIENPICHNFHKPNMSSAYGGDTAAGYGEHVPRMTKLWRSADGCRFISKASFSPALYSRNGAPYEVFSSYTILSPNRIEVNISAINKTASRLAESLWVTFKPDGAVVDPAGWQIRYFGNSDISPADVVEHGAVHLHGLGPDATLIHGAAGLEIVSLDVPIVSAGLLWPFPTAENNRTRDNSTVLINSWIAKGGWHFNIQNQIWNTNFPQWYPFDPNDTELLARFRVSWN